MKKHYLLILLTFFTLLGTVMQAQSFTPGNIVIARMGDGTPNTGKTMSLFLDEYTPNGALVQSVPLPATNNGSNLAISHVPASGESWSGPYLTRSANKQFVTLIGYKAPAGSDQGGGINNTFDRVIANIKYDGTVNTSTSIPLSSVDHTFSWSAVTDDGTRFWSSHNSGLGGIRYSVLGQSTATEITSGSSGTVASLNIVDGQLYPIVAYTPTTISGGLPTTGPQSYTLFPGISISFSANSAQVFYADLNPFIPGIDVLYMVRSNSNALRKYSLDPATNSWVLNGTIGTSTDKFRGITGIVNGSAVKLFFVWKVNDSSPDAGEIGTLSDNTGYTLTPGSFTGTPSTLISPSTNTFFRGIALAPEAPPPCPSPAVTVDYITPTTASFSWAGISTAGSYQYAITTSSTPPANGTTINANNYVASGLNPNTSYYFHLRTFCVAGNFSSWITVPFFTKCYSPTQINVSNITNSSASISWPNNPGVSGYQYAVTTLSTAPNAGTFTASATATAGSLSGGTLYYVYVRAKCGNEFSEWVKTSFTTECFKPQGLVATVETTKDAATIRWNGINGIGARYEYALMNSENYIDGSMWTTADTTLHFTNLNSGTKYYLHIRANCSIRKSDWTIIPFTINGVNAFPNPVNTTLQVEIYGPVTGKGTVKIFDASGKLIRQKPYTGSSISFGVEGLGAGIYIVKYQDGAHIYTRQILKQ